MVGILLSYWGGLFSGATLVSGRVNADEYCMMIKEIMKGGEGTIPDDILYIYDI